MRYLVTGADGFLGNHICEYLKTHDKSYVAAVRKAKNPHDFQTGDLAEFTDWAKLFRDCDVVIHAAAKAHDMSNSAELKKVFFKVNFEMTQTLALKAKENHVKKFLFISTIKVNGEESLTAPFTANDTPNPSDDYAVSKHMAEQQLLKMHQPGVFDVIIIRPCLIYGAGVKGNFQSLIKLTKSNLPLPFGLVKNQRSFVSVDNLISLIMTCLSNERANGEVFLAADGYDLSMPELIQIISTATKSKTILIPVPVFILKLILKILGKSDLSQRLFMSLQVDLQKNKELLYWQPANLMASVISKMSQ